MGSLKDKQHFNIVGLLFLGSFFISCQSLNHIKSLNVKPSDEQMASSPLIDKSYLEYQASLAYLKAETAFLEHQTETALEYLKTAQIFSSTPSLHLRERQADFYKKEGLLTEAVYHYKKLEQEHKDKRRFQTKLIECYVLNGLYSMALEENKKLLEKEPDSSPLWFQKAILLMSQKKWDESLKIFQHILSQNQTLKETAQAFLFQSYVLTKLNREEEALERFDRLLELDITDEQTSLSIAGLYKKIGKERWAVAYLKKFQEERGQTKAVSSFLFDTAFSAENWKEAFYYTQQLEDLGELVKKYRFYKVIYLMELRKYEKAVPYLVDLISENPSQGQYHYMLAVSYKENQKWEKATQAYQKVPVSSPYFLLSRLQLAGLWQKQGQSQESLKLLKKLVFETTKMSPKVVFFYVKSLWKLGHKKSAVSVLTLALKKDPLNQDLFNLREAYFKELGLLESASRDTELALQNDQAVSFLK